MRTLWLGAFDQRATGVIDDFASASQAQDSFEPTLEL